MDQQLAAELLQTVSDRRELLEQLDRITAGRQRSSSILVACTPKSGSTFAARVLAEATGFTRREFIYDINGHNGWDLHLPKLLAAAAEDRPQRFVAQQHLLATPPNLELIKLFNFKTVILVRNIFDTVISLRDHAVANRDDTSVIAIPPLHVPDNICDLDSEAQFDWIIDFKLPWYIKFLVGWSKIYTSRAIKCVWATYDDLMSNGILEWRRLLGDLGINLTVDEVVSAVTAASSNRHALRYNKGVPGRGLQVLSDHQLARIVALTRHYPDIDFASFGIPDDVRFDSVAAPA